MECKICGNDLWKNEEKNQMCEACEKRRCSFCNSHNIKRVIIMTYFQHIDYTGSSTMKSVGNTFLCFDCGKISREKEE